MTLLEAARQALPGIAWEQVSSSGVEYVYGKSNSECYGLWDHAELTKVVSELTSRRDALDDLLGAVPRRVLTDQLSAARVAVEKLPPYPHTQLQCSPREGCHCTSAASNTARSEARRALGLEVGNG